MSGRFQLSVFKTLVALSRVRVRLCELNVKLMLRSDRTYSSLIESSPGLKLLNRGNAATVQQFQAGRKVDKLARNGDTNSVRQAPEVVVRAP